MFMCKLIWLALKLPTRTEFEKVREHRNCVPRLPVVRSSYRFRLSHGTLNVVATPREKTLEPAAKTMIDVEVKDALGKWVDNSEVAVVVVDESVLALTDYVLSDPLSVFYGERAASATDYHSRTHLRLSDVGEGFGYGPGRGGAGGGGLTETVQSVSLHDRL